MATPSAANFLNLDLEIEATSDLRPLAEHFKGRAFVLFLGPTDGGFRLALEPLIEGKLNADPATCTEHFLGILEALPENLLNLWSGCRSRVFDYGFDGGLESPPNHMNLPTSTLARAAKLDLGFRITVYPFRERSADEE